MSAAGRGGRLARTLARLAVVVLIAWAATLALDWVKTAPEAMPGPGGRLVYYGVLVLALAVYAVLLALPYVPGVEIGIMILAMQGPAAALPVYLATLSGLGLAFWLGRLMPPGWVAGALADLGLRRAAALVGQLEGMTTEARLELLSARLPRRLAPLLGGGRYLVLAVLLNLPGNWLLGGGGGIMLAVGLSRLFGALPVLATVGLAVAPVPLIIWGFGIEIR